MNEYRQPIDSYHRPMICRIGQHEVGHYIVAKILGFKTGAITLQITDLLGGHRAGSEIVPACALSGDQSIIDYLERRVTVLYSGALAESLSSGKLDNEYALNSMRTGGAMRDYDKGRELIQLIRNVKFTTAIDTEEIQAGLDLIDRELWNRAASIVEAEHLIIEGLGSRLASEINHVGQLFTLSEAELDSLPSIQERFGR